MFVSFSNLNSNNFAQKTGYNCSFSKKTSADDLARKNVAYVHDEFGPEPSKFKDLVYSGSSKLSPFQKVGTSLAVIGSFALGVLTGKITVPQQTTSSYAEDYDARPQNESQHYSGLGSLKDEFYDKLGSKLLTSNKREEIKDKIDAIEEFEAKQKEYVSAVQTGDKIKFTVNKSLTVKNFKNMYGVKDGYFLDYNSEYENRGVYDSAHSSLGDSMYFVNYDAIVLNPGDTVELPSSSLELAENFKKMYKENGFSFSVIFKGEE